MGAWRHAVALLAFPMALAGQKIIVHLSPATSQAFDQYVLAAEAKMDWRPRTSAKPGGGVDLAPIGGSPIQVPDGMIHDWVGGAAVPGATVEKALAMFQDYADYKKSFAPDVIDSKALTHDGNEWTSSLRMAKRSGLIGATVDSDYAIRYRPLEGGAWSIESHSTSIRELDGDKLLPEGTGQGLLWRVNSYWLVEPRGEGLYIECRAISLTRDIPTGLGWIVRPFLSSVPRDSLRATVEEARKALR